jgi:hypothetical protein
VQGDILVAIEQWKRDLKTLREENQLLALQVLLTEEQVAFFKTTVNVHIQSKS